MTMRMIRTGVAIALLLGVSVVNAAGLGKLTVNSSLGQPLNAEIDLVSLQPDELDSLTARVAPPDAFREARIEYSSALRLLRFSVEKRPGGQPYLKVTSVAPINEPFVDVLVEVTWPAGRIQREYPILLDPPGYAQQAAPPTVAAATESRAPEIPPATVPASSSPAPADATADREPSVPGPSAQAEMAATPGGTTAAAGDDSYGPVQRGDTLSKIAEQVKPADVSLEQMLVALYRENKTAFVNNNMNRLKTGQILKVPSAEDVSQITPGAAGREIRTHVADWRAYREQLAARAASAPARADSTNVATGRVGSAALASPAVPPAEPRDVLKLSRTEGGKAAAAAGKGGTQDRLNALQEEVISKEQALRESQSRVADLEKQIRDMQRLLDLKTGAPAASAAKAAAAPATPSEPPQSEPPKAAAPAASPEPAASPDTRLAEAGKAPEPPPETPAVASTAPAAEPKVAEAPKPAPSASPKADTTKVAAKKAPPPQSLTDEILDNPAYLAAGVGLLALAGLGGFLFMRRRRESEEGAPSSAMTSAFPSDLKADSTTAKPAAGLVDTGNSSFLTDFDKTGPGTIDTDEVDPVAEAEVYIAYGRDAQAEEILKEAMARDRGRHEIALKLLEIYHARKSATAFETVAKELRTAVGESHPMWQKAAAMGAQIDPDNPLYGAAATSTGTYAAMFPAAPAPVPAAAPKPDLDFDLASAGSAGGRTHAPDFDLNTGAQPESRTSSASQVLDFDITPSSSAPPSAVDFPSEAHKDEKPTFDFDLSGLDLPSSSRASAPDLDLGAKPAGGASSASIGLADLSLDGSAEGEAVGTKLELAKAYLEIGDKDGAREILQEVAKEGSSSQKDEAEKLISSL